MFRRHVATGAAALTLALATAAGTSMTVLAAYKLDPGAKQYEELDPAQFDRSENIDHPYWPLRPGMEMVYEGTTEDDEGKLVPHRLVMIVTDLTRMVAGVRVRVVLEADYSQGKMIEQELAYFAQDKAGNVWHMGQYSEVYAEDMLMGGRIFYPGQPEGAKGGIMVPANAAAGTPSFSEGYGPPPYNWTDRGRVHQVGQKTKVKAGSYDDVIVIAEFDTENPEETQLKYYARDVGSVRVGFQGEGGSAENLELVKATRLDAKGLDAARDKALAMEKRASIYCTLPPMERTPIAE